MEISAMEDPSSASKKQKHGVACVPCAAAKTKCLRDDKASSCERCVQLNKQCTSQIPMPRKRKAGPPTTARVAQLEQKLDGLVTLLTSQQVAVVDEEDSVVEKPASHHEGLVHSFPASLGSRTTSVNNLPGSSKHWSPTSDTLRDLSTSTTDPALSDTSRRPTVSFLEESTLPFEDERLILDTFYTRMLPYFPFAVLEADDTPLSLQKEKPFLWKVIKCIASTRDRKRQEALGAEIMQEVTNKLLLAPIWKAKSLELLQGIILFSAWNHYQFMSNGQLSTLLFLAKALTTSLGLDRAPGATDRRALWMNGNPLRCPGSSSSETRMHTLAEQRALLSCYYLTMTRIKLGGSSADSFYYTPYLEKCCQSLEATRECQSDLLLVHLVRLQSIVQEIEQTFPFDEVDTFKALGTPVALCIKAFRTKLSALRSSLLPEFDHNPVFLMTYYFTEMALYEVALYDSSSIDGIASTFHLQLDRLGLLHACLASLVAYMNVYTKLPQEDVASFPFTIWMQSGLAILTGIELTFSKLEGWDTRQVRDSIDIGRVIDGEIEKLEGVAEKRQLHYPEEYKTSDIFWGFGARMRKTRKFHDSKMELEAKQRAGVNGTYDIDMTATMDMLLNGWDDSFLQTFVSDQWDNLGHVGSGYN